MPAGAPDIGAVIGDHLWSMIRHLVSSKRDAALLAALLAVGWLSAGLFYVEAGQTASLANAEAKAPGLGQGWHYRAPPPFSRISLRKADATGERQDSPR